MSATPSSRMQRIESADVSGKRVLYRADLNVPMDGGSVSDATRIERVLPALKDLTARGAKVLVLSHFGRPKGKRVPEMSLKPVADALASMLEGVPVSFATDCVGPEAESAVSALHPGEILVLENLRFHAGEEANDEGFARALCRLGDLYVNDAFSCAHRAHASTEAIARLLPAFAGPLMCAEIEALQSALENPERPVAAVVGGAKVSTKIPVLTNLTAKVDLLIVGGGMANTFLQAQGIDVGASLSEPDLADTARGILKRANTAGCEILLPLDAVVAKEFKAGAEATTVPLDQVPGDAMILDVGPKTLAALSAKLETCKTLLWNGPLGAFEIDPFGAGTFALARQAAELTKAGKLVTVAGGGDTVAALNAATVTQDFTYVSTAGGAFLEWLEGKHLPGVKALEEAGAGQPFARSA